MLRLKIGSIFFNTVTREHFPGVPDFVKGYYKVTGIQDGYLTSNLKPEDRLVYTIRRCSKDGSKLMKYFNGMYCKGFDKQIESGIIQIVKE
jgi:hypothetical protein